MTFDQTANILHSGFSPELMDWQEFLRRRCIGPDRADLRALHADKIVLITGGGGSIGSCLARFVAESGPREIILLDSSEHNLYQAHAALTSTQSETVITPVLMDIAFGPHLSQLFAGKRPDIVYHTAAFKHVPLLERNPMAAVRSNILGAYALAQAARLNGIPRVVAISTDKAVNPRSVLGVTKRVAELVFLAFHSPLCRMTVVRFGNVLATRGSVVPLFLRQISQGGPVTVAHPQVRRYFLTIEESIRFVVESLAAKNGGLFVPELGEPIEIVRLAKYLIRISGYMPGGEIPIAFTGLRPGDKMTEDLAYANEHKRMAVDGALFEVETRAPSEREIEEWIAQLKRVIGAGDFRELVDTFCRIVPEYRPSRELNELSGRRGLASHA